MAPRNEEQNARLRAEATAAIVDGAMKAFAERGYHAATTAEVAQLAGVSKGLIYNYFRSKEELLVAVIEERLGVVLRELAEIPAEADPRDRLRLLLERLIALARRDREPLRLYLTLLLDPAAAGAIAKAAATLGGGFSLYYDALRRVMEDVGHPRPLAASLALNSAMNGLLLNLAIQPDLHEAGRFPIAEIIDVLIEAFAAPKRTGNGSATPVGDPSPIERGK